STCKFNALNMFDAFKYIDLILEALAMAILDTSLSPQTFTRKLPFSQWAQHFIDVPKPAMSQLFSLFIRKWVFWGEMSMTSLSLFQINGLCKDERLCLKKWIASR